MIDAIRDFFDTYLQGSWTSIIDILLVAFVIYWLFILIRGTRAVRIVIGLSILYLVYLAARLLNLQLLTQLMERDPVALSLAWPGGSPGCAAFAEVTADALACSRFVGRAAVPLSVLFHAADVSDFSGVGGRAGLADRVADGDGDVGRREVVGGVASRARAPVL